MMARSLLAAALFVSWLAPVLSTEPAPFEGSSIEIPVDLSTDHVAIEVFVNGQGAFPFNLDTYAVTTACVDERFAKRMKLKKVDTVMNGDGSGALRERDIVLIPELRIGQAVFKNVRALVDVGDLKFDGDTVN